MRVADLPLPDILRDFVIRERGIQELYPPQEEAVRKGLFDGKSIVMCTSTATGKTLMAELAMINAVLTKGVKAILAVPLRALAYEKARDLRIYEKLGVRIAVTTGEYDKEDAWLMNYDIVVTTYEKLDSLLRHKAEWLRQVGVLVIDEIHYIDDDKRGPTIESIIAKVKALGLSTQLLALSATIGNAEEIANYLDADLVVSDWRPVKLKEGVYYDGVIYYSDGSRALIKDLGNPVLSLVMDTIVNGGQALVFTNSRSNTVKLAQQIAHYICNYGAKIIEPGTLMKISNSIIEASQSKLLGEELARVVKCGVAFHHAGLDMDARSIVENSFRDRLIKAVVATTTLAAGVNLPARRVIIHEYRRYEPGIGMEELPVMEYKQMAGRAGRPGLDPYGEAVLIARSEDEIDYLIRNYISARVEDIRSKFLTDKNLATHILSAIASGYASSIDDVMRFVSSTLGYVQGGFQKNEFLRDLLKRKIDDVINFLVESGFLERRNDNVVATPLGSLLNNLYLDPYTANTYIRGLKARDETNDLGYTHLIIQSPEVPRLRVRRNEFDDYLELVLDNWDYLLIKPPITRDEIENGEFEDEEIEDYLSTVKTAVMLLDWANEVSEDDLYKNYDVGPGDLRVYSDLMDWLASAVARLAGALGMRRHEERLNLLKWRLTYGVKDELIELVVNLEGVGRARARALYNAGFKSVEDIANADPRVISMIRGFGDKLARSIIEQARRLTKEGRVVKPSTINLGKEGGNKQGYTRRKGSLLDYL
ncbi:DEAD/DEAH box helicase [Vulcanisaeta distributa]|uniref:ATP-dependent DNA helicase Hel308 n=1 Tax=Vulcanisaeta distributa (strain DSM 14429 / JCM 11212 / NBRC 100878 / IC-017) TaxID=572478 RepID=E1QUS6_VULDI|nr:DEAD/DEAH box helicase [Vulcanisaeta distributa]ADN49929.1 DEAD/DEAH box helicase domain protein [Vulcanisaeta distributa DSM 14429]